jgi:hypothetical protein
MHGTSCGVDLIDRLDGSGAGSTSAVTQFAERVGVAALGGVVEDVDPVADEGFGGGLAGALGLGGEGGGRDGRAGRRRGGGRRTRQGWRRWVCLAAGQRQCAGRERRQQSSRPASQQRSTRTACRRGRPRHEHSTPRGKQIPGSRGRGDPGDGEQKPTESVRVRPDPVATLWTTGAKGPPVGVSARREAEWRVASVPGPTGRSSETLTRGLATARFEARTTGEGA